MILLLVIVFFLCLIVGIPIAFCLGLSALSVLLAMGNISLNVLAQKMFSGIDMFPLMAIPFFVLAGELMNVGGVTGPLVRFSNKLVGHIRGSLAHTNIVASMFFAGITGAAVADTSAIGSIMIPAMEEEGFETDFSTAVTCASSTIGPIIPPSISMVVYAVTTGVSIGALFLAGMIPGIIVGLSLMALVYYFAVKNNFPKGDRATLKEVWKGFKTAILALIMPIIILGGVLTGIFTATEAAAVAVVYAFVVGLFVYKKLTLKMIPKLLIKTCITTATILLIIGSADILAYFLTILQVPAKITSLFFSLTSNPYLLLLMMNCILLFVGMFMETGAAIILLAPILAPVVIQAGFHPIHVGFSFVMSLVIGLATPPLGVVLFVGCGIADISLEELAKKIWPFLVVELAVLLLVTLVPAITMYLPKMFGYV